MPALTRIRIEIEGIVQDKREVPAWSERRQYAELAAEYGGYHQPMKGDERGGGGIILILPGMQSQPGQIGGTVIEARIRDGDPAQDAVEGEETNG